MRVSIHCWQFVSAPALTDLSLSYCLSSLPPPQCGVVWASRGLTVRQWRPHSELTVSLASVQHGLCEETCHLQPSKLMLRPFHLRCKTMDFQDAQEMLMVIFNVWFKLNYISHWVDPFQHEGQWCLMFMFMVGLYPYSVSSVSSGAQTALSFTPESAHNMTTVWPSAPTGPLTTDLERSRQFSSRQFSSLQKIHSHEWPAGWLTETAGCPTGGRRRCPASNLKTKRGGACSSPWRRISTREVRLSPHVL